MWDCLKSILKYMIILAKFSNSKELSIVCLLKKIIQLYMYPIRSVKGAVEVLNVNT